MSFEVFQRLAQTLYNINFIYRYHFWVGRELDYVILYRIVNVTRAFARKNFPFTITRRMFKILFRHQRLAVEDRGELNAIYKPRCTSDCMPLVRKRYNAWSYETFIGSLVRSVFWCNGDITATRKRASTYGHTGMKLEHTRGGKMMGGEENVHMAPGITSRFETGRCETGTSRC